MLNDTLGFAMRPCRVLGGAQCIDLSFGFLSLWAQSFTTRGLVRLRLQLPFQTMFVGWENWVRDGAQGLWNASWVTTR